MKTKPSPLRPTSVTATPRRLALAYRTDSIVVRRSAPRKVVKTSKILVPVDFSARSRQQLRAAAGFARKMGAQIVILHLYEGTAVATPVATARQRDRLNTILSAAIRENLAKLKAEFPDDAEIQKAALIADTGEAAVDIPDKAESIGADLIVIARRTGSRIRHLLQGSKAAGIIRNARCPVMIIPTTL